MPARSHLTACLLATALAGCVAHTATGSKVSEQTGSVSSHPFGTAAPTLMAATIGATPEPFGVKAPVTALQEVETDTLFGTVTAPAKLLTEAGAGILSNNGSTLRLLADDDVRPLPGVDVSLVDAAGQAVTGPDGAALVTTTDAAGTYRFHVGGFPHNLIVRVDLGDAGQLQAIAPKGQHGSQQVDANLASTLTAGYILAHDVTTQADPVAALDRLTTEVEAQTRAETEQALAAAPDSVPATLDTAAIVAAVSTLRQTDPALDEQLDTVHQQLNVGATSASVTDGPADGAQFDRLAGLAIAPDGTVYLADQLDNLIRAYTPDGKVKTVAGSGLLGSADGQGTAASFSHPTGLALATDGNLYVGDVVTSTIRKVTPDGAVTTLMDGAKKLVLSGPQALVADPRGGVYVAYKLGVAHVDAAGKVTKLAGAAAVGFTDGQGAAAAFYNPMGIALDPAGNLTVSDASNERLRRVTPDGTVTTFLGNGTTPSKDGTGLAAAIATPEGIAAAADGSFFVASGATIRLVTSSGGSTVFAGKVTGTADGKGPAAKFTQPFGVAIDGKGQLWVTDRTRLCTIAPDGTVKTVAGSAQASLVDGDAAKARFAVPMGVVGDAAGNLYVADMGNNAVRKVTPDGQVSTLAGRGDFAVVDGQGRAAAFYQPRTVVLDAQGNLLVGEHNRIRKVTPDGLVTTYAGGGKGTYADGAAKAAAMGVVTGLALAPDGTLYFSDYSNLRLRKVTPDGQVVSVAGTGVAGSADGPGSAASFGQLQGLALGPDGAVYVADRSNHVIRRVAKDGTVSTWGGTLGKHGVKDGKRGVGLLQAPMGLAFDAAGNLLVSQDTTNLIRKITPDGTISTVKLTDPLASPQGLWIAPDGSLVVADSGNNLLRRVTP